MRLKNNIKNYITHQFFFSVNLQNRPQIYLHFPEWLPAEINGNHLQRMELGRVFGLVEVVDNPWSMVKAVFAEFVGLIMLLILGFGSGLSSSDFVPDLFHKSIGGGLGIIASVQTFFHISGAHLNPAITIPMVCVGKTKPLRAILYIAAQIVGAVVATAVLIGLFPDLSARDLLVRPDHALTTFQVFAVEFMVTFVLMIAGCTLADENALPTRGTEGLIMGIIVISCHLFAIKFTGCGLNPARVLGPAILANKFENIWIYCVGEISGGITAALCYFFVFAERKQQHPHSRRMQLRPIFDMKVLPRENTVRSHRHK